MKQTLTRTQRLTHMQGRVTAITALRDAAKPGSRDHVRYAKQLNALRAELRHTAATR